MAESQSENHFYFRIFIIFTTAFSQFNVFLKILTQKFFDYYFSTFNQNENYNFDEMKSSPLVLFAKIWSMEWYPLIKQTFP